jgi:hypothetical protein
VLSCYEELEAILVPSLKSEPLRAVEFSRYIDNYPQLVERVDAMFRRVDTAWQGQRDDGELQPLEVQYNTGSLQQETHLTAAAVATRAELLQKIQSVMADLQAALDSLLFDRTGFTATRAPRGKPAFVWLDRENFKTALRAFTTFWIATAIWMEFNPPGGFMFVTMCTVLIPLVSYTPVTPKLLFILFTLGFAFALPAYVFLLPQLTHWLELAAFLFSYAFIGFYVLPGPVSIFFLLGLFTLGIQNTMSYNFDAILLSILMFYLVCSMLIISVSFPFTSKPERLYASLRRRFFEHCALAIRVNTAPPGITTVLARLRMGNGAALLTKMKSWGAMIDDSYFPANGTQQINALNRACELLYGQLQIMALRKQVFAGNPLITAARRGATNSLAQLCDALAQNSSEEPFQQVEASLVGTRQRLDEFLGNDYLHRYDRLQLAQFYVYLNLQASILASIEACREAQAALDWQQLGDTRF